MTLALRVAESRDLNPLVRLLRLRADDGAVLPGYEPGAHVRVQVTLADGKEDWRHYSLVNLQPGADLRTPREYVIAIRREDAGRGGSRFMHTVQAGDLLTIEPPKNDFPLGAGRAVLVAGGIGITPLASMAVQCRAAGQPVRLHYAGRSRTLLAFLPELQDLLREDPRVHADDEAGAPLDVGALLDACAWNDTLYVCGPQVMLDAVLAGAQARGWPRERVKFELFTAPPVSETEAGYEVVLSQSGRTLQVAPGQSLLECLEHAGCDPMFDCRRGECGVCSVAVLEGEIEHRDYFLSDAEKASGKVMQICVSRARGPRLVLDM
jgi:vanillate O-demethylase ferredoxin subunit